MKALILSGGGARGAYQVGVLRAVGDIARDMKIKNPFHIYTGVSAGAINASFLAAGADDFPTQVENLVKLWSGLRAEQIFRTDIMSLGKIGFRWMGELSFGGITGSTPGRALLDTSPLEKLIKDHMDFERSQALVTEGQLTALGLTALDYLTSTAITFVQGREDLPDWARARRRSRKATIAPEHIMGSSAIPLLFPPVKIGSSYFGDGCVRNLAPMSPAIHLGASHLFVIGVRRMKTLLEGEPEADTPPPPSVARVLNVLMNSVLLDGIETDIERLNRINEFLNRLPEVIAEQVNFRKVTSVWIHPIDDIGLQARTMSVRLPRLIRYLLKGLGPLDDASEIISYLLFDPQFCTHLIEMGHRDGLQKEREIRQFLKA